MKHEAKSVIISGAIIAVCVAAASFGVYEFLTGEDRQYAKAQEQAKIFAARCGIQAPSCANEECGGLLNGKPVSFFCLPSGCAWEAER